MKILLLTGIAVLLLATGAAHTKPIMSKAESKEALAAIAWCEKIADDQKVQESEYRQFTTKCVEDYWQEQAAMRAACRKYRGKAYDICIERW
jgi:hypothetical protein